MWITLSYPYNVVQHLDEFSGPTPSLQQVVIC